MHTAVSKSCLERNDFAKMQILTPNLSGFVVCRRSADILTPLVGCTAHRLFSVGTACLSRGSGYMVRVLKWSRSMARTGLWTRMFGQTKRSATILYAVSVAALSAMSSLVRMVGHKILPTENGRRSNHESSTWGINPPFCASASIQNGVN